MAAAPEAPVTLPEAWAELTYRLLALPVALMAIAVQQIDPIAHLPLVLGVLRRLEVAIVIDRLIPPHPAHVLSCGRGVEALVLAILDGDHALYKVGKRLEERGMVALLQPGLTRASL